MFLSRFHWPCWLVCFVVDFDFCKRKCLNVCVPVSLVAVTDTYSGTSLQHQRYYYWWQQHHSISLSSQPWCHFLWTFDYEGAFQQCLPIFFLPPEKHQQNSKSTGYEDNCHHCPDPSHFPTWLLQLSAMWTPSYSHKDIAEGEKCSSRSVRRKPWHLLEGR